MTSPPVRPTRPHHRGSRFTVPWETLADMPSGLDMLRLIWEQLTGDHPPDPDPGEVPREEPRLATVGAAVTSEIRATWIGHATWLLQVGGINVLTDPHLTRRASPSHRFGPERLTSPGLAVGELPRIHAVVLSHDHYDHLDRRSVDALHDRFGDDLSWFTPLGYRDWFAGRSVRRVTELDWDGTARMTAGGGHGGAGDGSSGAKADATSPAPPGTELSLTALPAQHWCRRGLRTNSRLWASWLLSFRLADGSVRTVYFGGDSGYFEGYARRIRPYGPFELVLLPIGAYEPRWFMEYAHMNPEDAVKAYRDLGGEGRVAGMHWGTFRLTFEHPLEPPERMRRAWAAAGLPAERLHLPGIGGTVVVE